MNSAITILKLSMDFENHKKLQAVCNEYALENTFEFKTLKCENNHYIIVCHNEGCPWRLHASSISGTAYDFRETVTELIFEFIEEFIGQEGCKNLFMPYMINSR